MNSHVFAIKDLGMGLIQGLTLLKSESAWRPVRRFFLQGYLPVLFVIAFTLWNWYLWSRYEAYILARNAAWSSPTWQGVMSGTGENMILYDNFMWGLHWPIIVANIWIIIMGFARRGRALLLVDLASTTMRPMNQFGVMLAPWLCGAGLLTFLLAGIHWGLLCIHISPGSSQFEMYGLYHSSYALSQLSTYLFVWILLSSTGTSLVLSRLDPIALGIATLSFPVINHMPHYIHRIPYFLRDHISTASCQLPDVARIYYQDFGAVMQILETPYFVGIQLAAAGVIGSLLGFPAIYALSAKIQRLAAER